MPRLTLKERIFYGLICNESRVYKHWYTRFLLSGVDLARITRVVDRIPKWRNWCAEWYKEGLMLENMAEKALSEDNRECARRWFHEAAGCYHVGQHFFYLDDDLKKKCLDRIWSIYPRALELTEDISRPRRVDIPFRGVKIPGYLRLQPRPGKPMIVQINGLDNLKEIEQHNVGLIFYQAGFNTIAFDGPGQGEMWDSMKMIPDYHEAVKVVIDWLEKNQNNHIDLERLGAIGFSMGGFFAPLAAAHDERIRCSVGNGGPADLDFMLPEHKANPILIKGFPHSAGTENLEQAVKKLNYDITKAPSLDRPMLILHSGHDRIIPDGKKHADKFMNWAVGEKELKFYPDGEHVCANYLDEALPYMVDWCKKHLSV